MSTRSTPGCPTARSWRARCRTFTHSSRSTRSVKVDRTPGSDRQALIRATKTPMKEIRTQVGIVGAGPAGLMLGRLLHIAGIDSIIIENRSEDYVVERVRAGVLEQGTVDLLLESGVGSRLQREGMFHDGIFINVFGKRHRIDMAALTGR